MGSTKLTNRTNLPQPLYDAIVEASAQYSKGDADFSVTQLLKPPRIVQLLNKHGDEIVEDVEDRIYSFLGTILHERLEKMNRLGVAERRMSMTVLGKKISGGMDRLDNTVIQNKQHYLQDYKFTTLYKVKDGVTPEFEQQLNIYAELLRENGHEVKGLEIVAILRDWSKRKALFTEGYPKSQVVVLNVPLWAPEKARAFLEGRVQAHIDAESKLPNCTSEERWARPSQWAVMKGNNKRALRVYNSQAEAEEHAAQSNAFRVEFRPGESIRCNGYCSVAPYCDQWKQIQGESK